MSGFPPVVGREGRDVLSGQLEEVEPASSATDGIEEHVAPVGCHAWMQIATGSAAVCEGMMEPPKLANGAGTQVGAQQVLHAALVGIGVGNERVAADVRMSITQAVEGTVEQRCHLAAVGIDQVIAVAAGGTAQVSHEGGGIDPEAVADHAVRG